MMTAAKKTLVEKAPAKRKPAKPNPVAVEPWQNWQRHLTIAAASLVMLAIGAAGGVWSASGIEIGPGRDDVLSQAYDADRVTQIAVLRELAAKGFKNDDSGREQATTWFNENRFRNRPADFRPYTSAVTDNFAAGTLEQFAGKLEAK
jgi:hypothetical protein